jgi:hypothetical protein
MGILLIISILILRPRLKSVDDEQSDASPGKDVRPVEPHPPPRDETVKYDETVPAYMYDYF